MGAADVRECNADGRLRSCHRTVPAPAEAERPDLLARLAAAVAPGGTLLWVGHDFNQRQAVWDADRFASVESLIADLPADGWEVEVAEVRARPGLGHEGDPHTIRDVILRPIDARF